MASNILLFGWKRSIPGREKISAQHFEEFVKYLGGLQQKGAIHGFETVFLDTHGGDLNGFFLIKADSAKLDALVSTTEWITHITRASLHLDGSGVVRGVTGNEVMERMALWSSVIRPKTPSVVGKLPCNGNGSEDVLLATVNAAQGDFDEDEFCFTGSILFRAFCSGHHHFCAGRQGGRRLGPQPARSQW